MRLIDSLLYALRRTVVSTVACGSADGLLSRLRSTDAIIHALRSFNGLYSLWMPRTSRGMTGLLPLPPAPCAAGRLAFVPRPFPARPFSHAVRRRRAAAFDDLRYALRQLPA
ncbi:MAG: hypothetical protein MdMp014T_1571 [Treponematales bacterium]